MTRMHAAVSAVVLGGWAVACAGYCAGYCADFRRTTGDATQSSDATRSTDATSRRRVRVARHRVDIARASIEELALLPEVGPGLAARIAADRALHGAYATVDDLARVEGLGGAKLEALRCDAFVGRKNAP
ncbi:MAG: Helix-hairpin-helix motif [Planctomycetota bacterium]|jgi:DNA uptake protein ComE-like DNA-binding protein